MGYVRMIKAGGLHFVSNSIRFVPDLDDIPNFEELTLKEEVGGGAGNNKDTMASEAAKTLDEVVANLGKNFSDNTEYFQVCFLLPAFQASLLLRRSWNANANPFFLSHATPKEMIGEEGKVTEGNNGSDGMLLLNGKADLSSLKPKIPTTKIYLCITKQAIGDNCLYH